MEILDLGIGLFRKIQQAAGLANEHDALLELAKGKFTTDPGHHTGEGMFFTARMFDRFTILSGTMYVSFGAGGANWVIEDPHSRDALEKGTLVTMKINPRSKRTTKHVFDRYASVGGEPAADVKRTHLAIRLARPGGEPLVSRSQAKRILSRLEQFDEAILDFGGVPEIGPAFADEIFRVFPLEHPRVRLIPVEANEPVMPMIVRAQEEFRRHQAGQT